MATKTAEANNLLHRPRLTESRVIYTIAKPTWLRDAGDGDRTLGEKKAMRHVRQSHIQRQWCRSIDSVGCNKTRLEPNARVTINIAI